MRLAITDAAPPSGVELDLWGVVFDLLPVTRSRQTQLDELEAQFNALDEDDPEVVDKMIDVLGRILDVQLQPLQDAKPKKKASVLVRDKWKADELTSAQLLTYVQRVAEAGRPT